MLFIFQFGLKLDPPAPAALGAAWVTAPHPVSHDRGYVCPFRSFRGVPPHPPPPLFALLLEGAEVGFPCQQQSPCPCPSPEEELKAIKALLWVSSWLPARAVIGGCSPLCTPDCGAKVFPESQGAGKEGTRPRQPRKG